MTAHKHESSGGESPAVKPQLALHHANALKEAGLDLSMLKNMPWTKIITMIEALLAIAKDKTPE